MVTHARSPMPSSYCCHRLLNNVLTHDRSWLRCCSCLPSNLRVTSLFIAACTMLFCGIAILRLPDLCFRQTFATIFAPVSVCVCAHHVTCCIQFSDPRMHDFNSTIMFFFFLCLIVCNAAGFTPRFAGSVSFSLSLSVSLSLSFFLSFFLSSFFLLFLLSFFSFFLSFVLSCCTCRVL